MNNVSQKTMPGMDSVRKPKTSTDEKQKPPARAEETRFSTSSSKPFSPEMKVWFSVIGSSLVIVAVWIATFSLPQSAPQNSDHHSSEEIKEALSGLRNSIEKSMRSINQQKNKLFEFASNTNSIISRETLSNEELKALTEQIVGVLNGTTTTSTASTISPASATKSVTTPPKLP